MSDLRLARRATGLALIASGLLLRRARRRARLDLEGRVVLITGGSRGLGLLLAREFGRRGACVAICARDEAELARAQLDLDRRLIQVHARRCDVSDFGQIDAFVESTLERFGQLDIIVNNASNIIVGPQDSMDWEDFRSALDVTFGGAVRMTLSALPYLSSDGRLVNISSIGGWVPVPHLLPYVAAKFALTGYSLALGTELRARGQRAITVLPGMMRTGSFLNALFKGRRRAELAWFALGATLPVVSIPGERAARRIVDACERGTPLVTLGWPAKLARVVQGLAPGAVASLLALVNRALPGPGSLLASEEPPEPGWRHRSFLSRPPFTWLGDRAARRFNEKAA